MTSNTSFDIEADEAHWDEQFAKSQDILERLANEAQEDYLKIILELINSRRVARVKEIAQRKNVSMPTVTEAMRKMAQDGLINYSAHEFIDLTS